MDYTQSNSYVTDAGTGNRMHLQAQAVPTAVSDSDLNGLFWEMLSVIRAAGITPAAFDKATPASFAQLLLALRSAGVFQTQATNDASTKAATTAFVNPGSAIGPAGWLKLPSGLIVQWANMTSSASADVNLTLPITFPNAIYQAFATPIQGTGAVASYSSVGPITQSSVAFSTWTPAGARTTYVTGILAIGK